MENVTELEQIKMNIDEDLYTCIEDINVMWNDLIRIHTELIDGTPGEHCVELRAIKRMINNKGKHSSATQSFHLWKADEKSKNRFISWYKEYIENQCCCIYYSIHCFDSTIKIEKKKQYSINAVNQLFTRVLVADLDHVSEEENKSFDKTMDMLGIPFQSIQTSLNGYQKRFYLSNQINDEYAVAKFTKLLINKGFNVDERLKNRGQVARLLGTINNKCNDPVFNVADQFEVRVDRDTDSLISAEDLFKKINMLPTVKETYKEQYLELDNISSVSKDNYKFSFYYDENKFIKLYNGIISEYYISLLQRPVKHMLIDTPESFTDEVVLFIIPYLKNTLNLSFEEIKIIMDKWAEINQYNEKDKYERIYYTEYYKGWGKYSRRMQEKYGSINFAVNYKVKLDVISINENTINIKRELFNSEIYSKLSNAGLMIFLIFLYEYKAQGKVSWTMAELIDNYSMGRSKALRILNELVQGDFISCIKSNKHNNEGYMYTLSKKYVALKTEKRLELTFTQVRELISLKENEAKLFLLLLYIIKKNVGMDTHVNQEDMAGVLGIDRSRVSRILSALNKKRLIEIRKVKINRFESNRYILLV